MHTNSAVYAMDGSVIARIQWILAFGFLVRVFEVLAAVDATGPKRQYRPACDTLGVRRIRVQKGTLHTRIRQQLHAKPSARFSSMASFNHRTHGKCLELKGYLQL